MSEREPINYFLVTVRDGSNPTVRTVYSIEDLVDELRYTQQVDSTSPGPISRNFIFAGGVQLFLSSGQPKYIIDKDKQIVAPVGDVGGSLKIDLDGRVFERVKSNQI